jgi:hypothetical protein
MAPLSGCTMIADFFERPGMVGPPFVYGVLEGEPEDSAAFWCKKSTPSDQPFLLVVKPSESKAWCGCPSTIEWRNFPGGLSVEVRTQINLEHFRHVLNPARPGPAKQIASGRLIVSYYDGRTEAFYCHEGAWLVAATE